ncbi:MAG: methylamine utilization protein MauJ [Longimicrobiaceae bacterium]
MAVIECAKGEDEAALVRIVRQFLNALSWREQATIQEMDVTYGPPLRHSTNIPGNSTRPDFDSDDLPDPSDAGAQLAIALYREGLTLQRPYIAYSFLSYFKVINICFKYGRDQKHWINSNWQHVTHPDAVERLQEILAQGHSIGEYLFESGRCAVAHAFGHPIVDPDSIQDQQRISRDCPVIRALAALLIQQRWQIPAPRWGKPV